eukprot:scaffold31468_cov36-Phaeocystis_antarctica.AAC.1
MRRILVCGDPKSAASSVANATFSGKRAAYIHTPAATSAGVADRPRAGLRSVHGVKAWTWTCGDGGGSETASPLGPSEVRTARPPGTLALQSFKGTGSWSKPKITSAPAARAPAEKPPSPAKRSTTFI